MTTEHKEATEEYKQALNIYEFFIKNNHRNYNILLKWYQEVTLENSTVDVPAFYNSLFDFAWGYPTNHIKYQTAKSNITQFINSIHNNENNVELSKEILDRLNETAQIVGITNIYFQQRDSYTRTSSPRITSQSLISCFSLTPACEK